MFALQVFSCVTCKNKNVKLGRPVAGLHDDQGSFDGRNMKIDPQGTRHTVLYNVEKLGEHSHTTLGYFGYDIANISMFEFAALVA